MSVVSFMLGKHVHLVERVCLLRHLPLMAVLWEKVSLALNNEKKGFGLLGACAH
jgi:hypothetical protein